MQYGTVEGFRLSPQQEHLWLLQQHDHSLPYYVQALVLIDGAVQVDTLKAAVARLVERHEILRTVFHCLPGMLTALQVITDQTVAWTEDRDLSHMDGGALATQLDALWLAAGRQDVASDAVLSLSLVTLSSRQCALVISLPALCADRATLEVVVAEIARCYAAGLAGSELSDEPLQYADLVEWQRDLLDASDRAGQIEYWRKHGIGDRLNLELPFQRRPQQHQPFSPESFSLTFDPDTVVVIEVLAQQYNTSVRTILLVCWQVLLWRFTQQSAIIIGMPFDLRGKFEELKGAIGPYVKYLPIAGYLADDQQLHDAVRQTDDVIRAAYGWQESFSWERITEETQAAQSISYCPFSFTFDEHPAAYVAANLTFSIARRLSYLERFTVQLACERQGATLVTRWDYDAQRLAPASVRRLGAAFQTLLRGLLEQPDTPLARLPLLSSDERTELVETFNATVSAAPSAATLHQLFEAQAARTPAATAVVGGSSALCYADLNAQANQLARHLQTLGVGPEVLVGVLLPRTPALLVALLGILKAGGAYVPLEHGAPAARLALTLGDAGVRVIVTDTRLSAELPPCTATLVTLDTVVLAQQPAHNLDVEVRAAQLAYVLYTSGSTGHPKGVMIAHQGLVNYLSWAVQAYDVVSGTGTLVHSPLSFDLTVTSLFGPLLCGRTSVLLPEEQELEALAAQLQVGGNYSLVKLTPAHLAVLAQTVTPGQVAGSARALIIGGEALHGEALAFWQTHAPATRLVNEYGPTETVVGCCVYEVGAERRAGPVPIGRPIANTQLYVLDEEQQPVPLGVTGELYIGGVQLARGYLGQAALTAAAFVPDSFSATPGARLYRTGDLVRYLPESDGILQFLGRNDHQVKLRGFRIELEEIEAVLRQHPAVHECVATMREDSADDQRLVAYVVLDKPATTSELHSFLQARLPTYMIPAHMVPLKVLPLTPNGKTDIHALPAPESAPQAALVAPRTVVEAALTDIWAQLLGVEQCGVHDSFFELGGHSLLAIRLMSRVQALFQVQPSMYAFFDAPTIVELANLIIANEPKAGQTEMIARTQQSVKTMSADDRASLLESIKKAEV